MIYSGVILLFGVEYDNNVDLFLIIGTWIGFGQELMDFIEDVIGLTLDSCNHIGVILFCLGVWLMTLSEQSMGIYLAVAGLHDNPSLQVVAIIVHSVIILIICCVPSITYARDGGSSI